MGMMDEGKKILGLISAVENKDLLESFAKYQQDIFALSSENVGLKEENAKLKQQLATREELVLRNNFYWIEGGEDPKQPYCVRCTDAADTPKPMLSFPVNGALGCPGCGMVLCEDGSAPDTHTRGIVQRTLLTSRTTP